MFLKNNTKHIPQNYLYYYIILIRRVKFDKSNLKLKLYHLLLTYP